MVILVPLTGCENGSKKAAYDEAVKTIMDASKQREFSRMQLLADSLGKAEVLSEAESYFWQGFAYYRMMQVHTAEFSGKRQWYLLKTLMILPTWIRMPVRLVIWQDCISAITTFKVPVRW